MKRGAKPFNIQLLIERGRIPQTWREDIINLGKNGSAEVHIVSYMGIKWDTHKRLMERCPEYLDAVLIAKTESEKWWFDIAKEQWVEGKSKNINSNHWSLIMRNQFGSRWSDRKEMDVTSKGDKINDKDITIKIIKPTNNEEDAES